MKANYKNNFMLNKVVRKIKEEGQQFTFFIFENNKYGDETDVVEKQITLDGIFHEQTGYKPVLNSESSALVIEHAYYIFTTRESIGDIKQGFMVKVNDKLFKVAGLNDVKQLDVAVDISLELMIDG